MKSYQAYPKKTFFLNVFFLTLVFLPSVVFTQEEKEKEKNLEKVVKITEEILVIGKAPKELPVSTVTSLDTKKILQLQPRDLSEAIKFAPGVIVTYGDKDTYSLKLRGVDSKRIALLVDGIPVYEPYYSTFDLKTVEAGGIDSLQITKGPSSVLYGPNTLGGIVNVITRRPGPDPTVSLNTTYGERNTRSLGFDSAFQSKHFAFAGTLLFQDSDGSYYPGADSKRTPRSNSDYQRLNLNTKLYYTPSSRTEILFNAGLYKSDYGMPPDLFSARPRYWRFKNWDRYTLNAGGYTALGERSTLRFRTFFVRYNNTLDQFRDKEMTNRQFESTFNNSVYGIFALGDLFINQANSLKLSVIYQNDKARTQDDVNLPWDEYQQGTFSAGVEDHFTFAQKWKLVAGLSIDYLDKFIGKNTSKINPLIGLKFSPADHADLHLSYSKKSKFPSMRSMYSPSSGNPNLLSEAGYNWEMGFTWTRGIYLTGSAFFTRFKDFIDSIRLPDNTRRYFNIGKSYINGFESQLQKSFKGLELTVNYTYLAHKNQSDDRPLDAIPNHSLNFDFSLFPLKQFRIGFFGLLASSSSWYDSSSGKLLDIPSYSSMDTVISYQWRQFDLFIKVTNVFDHSFYTEPGFPWRGRYIELGIKVNLFQAKSLD